ncbi:hypothetical protein ABT093_38530 [Kitasatospora sp. NPDC002551]|uniref:hypothetical protein n=1 Tax=Kitasatospora sp. NPDC002551 TaxID=3154539 RepID=UPI0033327509
MEEAGAAVAGGRSLGGDRVQELGGFGEKEGTSSAGMGARSTSAWPSSASTCWGVKYSARLELDAGTPVGTGGRWWVADSSASQGLPVTQTDTVTLVGDAVAFAQLLA